MPRRRQWRHRGKVQEAKLKQVSKEENAWEAEGERPSQQNNKLSPSIKRKDIHPPQRFIPTSHLYNEPLGTGQ